MDLVIRNARIVDGSGMPAYRGDVGVKDGRIVGIGKIDGPARRTLDADGRVVAPGFIDIHTHFDAQVTWDPLCTFSCYHGVTTAIFGNCSLAMAPVGAGDEERYWLSQMLSYVEAIPLEDLQAGVAWSWHSIGEYMDALDRRLGINVGCLIGHSAVRRNVMGEASQERHATGAEIEAMQRLVADGMAAGALGLSFSRSLSHRDLHGRPDPASVASMEELLALARTVGDSGTGCLQVSNGSMNEMAEQMCTKLSQASGRPVTYNSINHFWNAPNLWREQLDFVEETVRQGNRAYPQTNARPADQHFTFKNCPLFRSFPMWDTVMAGSTEEKLRAFKDPATREALRAGISGELTERTFFNRRWDLMLVNAPALERNAALKGKSIEEIARQRGTDPFDTFLDLAIEEDLNTWFVSTKVMGGGDEAQAALLNSPCTVLGLSDAGAHVTYDPGYGATTFLLSYWVRERGALSLEEAVRKVTFVPASLYGMHDRGLLRPGMAADMVVFDPDTIDLEEVEEVHDLPAGGARLKQLAKGIEWTIVNGEVLIERGEHTGTYPGRVARNRSHAASLVS